MRIDARTPAIVVLALKKTGIFFKTAQLLRYCSAPSNFYGTVGVMAIDGFTKTWRNYPVKVLLTV